MGNIQQLNRSSIYRSCIFTRLSSLCFILQHELALCSFYRDIQTGAEWLLCFSSTYRLAVFDIVLYATARVGLSLDMRLGVEFTLLFPFYPP
jgi:hypothetical protein